MDVQCERCKTEYEFDDALVSGRGTTVRCTNCGHQFKVRRAGDAGELHQEQWVVTTASGRELTYLTLRELQRAILARQVARTDVLRRGASASRALGSIAELEPFFDRASNRPPPQGESSAGGSSAQKLPLPPGVPAAGELRLPPPRSAVRTDPGISIPRRTAAFEALRSPLPPPAAPQRTPSTPPVEGSPRRRIDTLRPPGAAVPPPSMPPAAGPNAAPATLPYAPVPAGFPAPRDPAPPPSYEPEPVTQQRPHDGAAGYARRAEEEETGGPLPPPTMPVRRPIASSIDEEAMADAMGPRSSYLGDPDAPPRRRRVGGWIVAAVLLAGVAVGGVFVAKTYLGKAASSAQAPLDPKVKSLLDEGEQALADGNLEKANELFVRASERAENDPRVLVDVAAVDAARADLLWLKLKLLAPEAQDEAKQTDSNFRELKDKALASAEKAFQAAPEDKRVIRAKVDALRIADRTSEARALASKISGGQEPETSYVLAALDLAAEQEPAWPNVIRRLGNAGSFGRAKPLLVYALARSGDRDAASGELEKLRSSHPLLQFLRAFIKRMVPHETVDGGLKRADAAPPTIAVSALPTGKVPPVWTAPTNDAEMKAALKDPKRAKAIYEARLAQNPGDADALCQLAAIARREGNAQLAITYYRRVLDSNPSYTPAILGLADAYYESGNHGEAVRMYRDYIDRFPESMVPKYVKDRAGVSTPPAETTAAPPATTSAAPPPTTTQAPATTTSAPAPATTQAPAPTTPPTATAPAPTPTVAPSSI